MSVESRLKGKPPREEKLIGYYVTPGTQQGSNAKELRKTVSDAFDQVLGKQATV